MLDFVFYFIKTLMNTQINKIHFIWPRWCTTSEQTHGHPTIKPWIRPNDEKNVKTVSPSSQPTTQNNQSVQYHRFNIEQTYEQGAQRQRDNIFYEGVVYNNDFPYKKLHKFEKEKRGRQTVGLFSMSLLGLHH